MPENKWNITFYVSRQRTGESPHFQSYQMEVDPDEYVLDGIERIWAKKDRTLTYRHACHHSTCGACGMLINGVEKLTCITTIRSITQDGGTIRVEPLRNFPVLSDLVVDMSFFYERIDQTHVAHVASLEIANLPMDVKYINPNDPDTHERLIDCLECGMCISACPGAATSGDYKGPGVLAAIQQAYLQKDKHDLLVLADDQDGVWRCHSAYECSEVCPSNVDPAWRIMNLRRTIISNKISRLFTHQGGPV